MKSRSRKESRPFFSPALNPEKDGTMEQPTAEPLSEFEYIPRLTAGLEIPLPYPSRQSRGHTR